MNTLKNKINSFKKILILVQGPYVKTTSNLIYELKEIFPLNKIILSCYDESIDESIKNLVFLKRNSDPKSILVPPRSAPLNLKRQATTIYYGCKDFDEEWVMKIRSDIEILNSKKLYIFN